MQIVVQTLWLGVIAVGLVGCTAADSGSPVRSAAGIVGFSTSVPEAKDFVRASRPKGELAYVPVGREPIVRATPSRDPGSVAALQQQLDQQRDSSEATARRALPAGAYGRALPSVTRAAAPAPASTVRPAADGSFPVNPNRARQMRENARRVQEN
jgi:hypothetical protein